MRILSLRFRNLNSLAGTWQIDFTHPDYRAGLFVITGPTGVGKTTILDAVCLALYGATPRLDLISQNSNEIMSRGCGECLAEVIFETPAGRFRSQWSQHRSRKQATGNLQPAQHEIVDDVSGRVLENSLSRTRAEVERISGMNFNQFTRSIMLAQGAFAAFLQSPPDERAALLEQITGAEIYSEISIRVHQRMAQEKEKLKDLESQLAGFSIEGANEDELSAQKKELDKNIKICNQQLNEKNDLLSRLERIIGFRAELSELKEQEKDISGEIEKFSPHKTRLEQSLKAQKAEPVFEQLAMARQNLNKTAGELAKHQKDSAILAEAESKAEAAVKEEGQKRALARSLEETKKPALIKARALDIQLEFKNDQLKKLKEQCAEKRKELCRAICLKPENSDKAFAGHIDAIQERLTERQKKVEALSEQIKKELGGENFSARRDELSTLEKKLGIFENLLALLKNLAQNKAALVDIEEIKSKTGHDLNRARRDLSLENERLAALEKDGQRLNDILLLNTQINSLEEQRAKLKTNVPCPLCGALNHPWTDQSKIPAADSVDAEVRDNQKLCTETRSLINRLTAQKATLEQSLKSNEERESENKSGSEELAINAGKISVLLAIPEEQAMHIPTVEKLQREHEQKNDQGKRLVKTIESLEKNLDEEKDKIPKAAEAVQSGRRLQKDYETLCRDLNELASETDKTLALRKQTLGDLEPEAEEQRLKSQLLNAEKALEAAGEAFKKIIGDHKANLGLLKEAGERAQDFEKQVAESHIRFLETISSAGFATEEKWAEAQLPEKERGEIEKASRIFDEKQVSLAARIKDTAERLAKDESLLGPFATETLIPQFEELKLKISGIDGNRQELQKSLGAVDQKLRDLRLAGDKKRGLLIAIETQKSEKNRWDKLHELIGSADGKKFRIFAQGLTFEILAGLANRQLLALSERYLLSCDPQKPLEFSVMDNYQAGEIRSTKNLSGGESFIVSLALALGLSQMASRIVRVDSLFLDEGFGTLDEDSLDTVLATLSGLRENGKLIGLISHIPALTSRVPVQIKVSPKKGPHSGITGPGVSGNGA